MSWWTIVQADARYIPLANESVQTAVTSPPYWGLRDYGTEPLIWGGDPECAHDWGEQWWKSCGGAYSSGNKIKWQHGAQRAEEPLRRGHPKVPAGAFCVICRAWSLPAPEEEKPWWEVLEFGNKGVTRDDVEQRYRLLAKRYHPDLGGDPRKFAQLNIAVQKAREALSA
jgi:hypothetical protein